MGIHLEKMLVQLLISLILSLLPVWLVNHDAKYHLGILLNEMMRKDNIAWLTGKIQRKSNEVIIKGMFNKGPLRNNTAVNNNNLLYFRFQTYLINKFKPKMKNYELANIQGDIKFNLNDTGNEMFVDTYESHKIYITIRTENETDKEDNLHTRSIVLRSTTASPDILKQYVKEHTITTTDNSTSIKIYNPYVRVETKNVYVKWEQITARTNKTLTNTVYDEGVKRTLFEDVNHFINNEEWYKYRGIPYKRGYFLYGPPGTGKTSVAKIIASTYDIPIYNLDLSTIETNDVLIKMMSEIYYETSTNPHYILLLEDAESSNFFQKNSKVTMDCLLNILDGVMEPYGRILILTSNNPDKFKEYQALMRPGRIDRYIEIGNCTIGQIKEMYDLFYEGKSQFKPNWEQIQLRNLSPAVVTKHLQDNLDTPEEFCKILYALQQ